MSRLPDSTSAHELQRNSSQYTHLGYTAAADNFDEEEPAVSNSLHASPDSGIQPTHLSLPDDHADKGSAEVAVTDQVTRNRYPWSISWTETKAQCRLAGPLILGNLLSFFLQLISTSFVGHTGAIELSGASLAYSFSVVTGYSVLSGLGSALETLCGQAFGAREYQKVGLYMQRAMVVLTLISLPLAILWTFMAQIYLALGQEPQLASKAGEYGVWLIPTLFAISLYMPLVKFLQSQSLVAPIFGCFGFTLVCHVPMCWALVFRSRLGYKGAALANSVSLWNMVLTLSVYVKFSPKCAATRAPFSVAALQDLRSFLKLAIPSALMTCLEWGSYEILVILSAFLPNSETQTGVIAICVNSESLLYMIPNGLASAVSTRVSNELGAGNTLAAYEAVNVARILGVFEALLVVVVLALARNVWGRIYSNDQMVVAAMASFVPFFAASSAFDALQSVLSGVVRGAGRQETGAYMNLASYYLAGLPTGCLLAFVAHLEGKGLWTGLIVGTIVQFVAYSILICFMDLEREAKLATARVGGASCSSTNQPLLLPTSPEGKSL